jgi:hypothetical protein
MREIVIVGHSNFFYWWPVWVVGFILGLLSLWSGSMMVAVPTGTEAGFHADITHGKGLDGAGNQVDVLGEDREVLVLPKGRHLYRPDGDVTAPPPNPRLHTSSNKNFGVIFCTVLVLVIIITNVPLRGMWSVMIIVMAIMLIIILSLAGWWPAIRHWWHLLDIRVNAGGYFFISIVLAALWLVTVLLFDKQIYMIFTPRQLKVCTEIGGGEEVYDTVGLAVKKQRSDLFRHWVLGLGSGDLIVNTAGARAVHLDFPNVLFIGKKVRMIEELMQKGLVIETK